MQSTRIVSQLYISLIYGAIAAPFIALSAYWITKGVFRLRQLWQIQRNRISSVGSIKTGQVEVSGEIATTATYSSPMSQMQCVTHYYTIERYIIRSRPVDVSAAITPFTAQEIEDERLKNEKDEARAQHWATVIVESGVQRFDLSDESGYVVVDPRGANMDFGRPQYSYEADAPDQGKFLPEPLKKIMREKGVDPNARLRFREWLLRPGENVLAKGMARPVVQGMTAAGSCSAQGAMKAQFEIGRSDGCELVLTNLGKGATEIFLTWQGGLRIIAGTLLALATVLLTWYLRLRE